MLDAHKERERQRRLAEGAQPAVNQPRGHSPSGGSGQTMRFVAIAGILEQTQQQLAVYPVHREGSVENGTENWFVTLGDQASEDETVRNTPAETEAIAVWPKLIANDFIPLIIRVGDVVDEVTEQPIYDYELPTGRLHAVVTLCPVYVEGGRWIVHNTVRMSWATPASGSIFSSCGNRSSTPPDGGQP